jgi:hypothetical protein
MSCLISIISEASSAWFASASMEQSVTIEFDMKETPSENTVPQREY